jgi:hypothetical protein
VCIHTPRLTFAFNSLEIASKSTFCANSEQKEERKRGYF